MPAGHERGAEQSAPRSRLRPGLHTARARSNGLMKSSQTLRSHPVRLGVAEIVVRRNKVAGVQPDLRQTTEQVDLAMALELIGVCVLHISNDVVVAESSGTIEVLGASVLGSDGNLLIRTCHVDDVAGALASDSFYCRWWKQTYWEWLHVTRQRSNDDETLVIRLAAQNKSDEVRSTILASAVDGVLDVDRNGAVTWASGRVRNARFLAKLLAAIPLQSAELIDDDEVLWEVRSERHDNGVLYMVTGLQDDMRSLLRDARWRRVLDEVTDGYWLLDAESRVVDFNRSASDMLLHHGDNMFGKVVDELLSDGEKRLSDGSILEVSRTPCLIAGGQYGMLVVARDVTDEHRLREALGTVVATLANVQARERTTLATKLHDDPIQRLVGVRWRVMQADAIAAAELERCYEALRDLVVDLRPQVLVDRGLRVALEDLEALDERIRVGVGELGSIPEESEELTLRNVREAVRNAVAHSKASWINVQVWREPWTVWCEVADDGVGVSMESLVNSSLSGHVGVVSMRETVLEAGGEFNITTLDSEGGTTVRFSIPVPGTIPPAPMDS